MQGSAPIPFVGAAPIPFAGAVPMPSGGTLIPPAVGPNAQIHAFGLPGIGWNVGANIDGHRHIGLGAFGVPTYPPRNPSPEVNRRAAPGVVAAPAHVIQTQVNVPNRTQPRPPGSPGVSNPPPSVVRPVGQSPSANVSPQRGQQQINPSGRLLAQVPPRDPGRTATQESLGEFNPYANLPPAPAQGRKRSGSDRKPRFMHQTESIEELALTREECAARPQCSICLEDFRPGDWVFSLKCSHIFHRECVSAWIFQHGSCPVCRTVIRLPGQ
jgi:hypothetical protein